MTYTSIRKASSLPSTMGAHQTRSGSGSAGGMRHPPECSGPSSAAVLFAIIPCTGPLLTPGRAYLSARSTSWHCLTQLGVTTHHAAYDR